ncbi:MAG: DUF4349 domain-containing protein [Oscillospiraceae bacterium]|jgi:predicted small secreted protein|nr:DUF4349 domain-containing protein [Bacillota bacterium]
MKRTPFGILALLLALTLLAGCSSNTSKSLAEDAWETPAFAQEAVGDLALPASNGTMSTEASPEVASATPEVATNRKLVKTAWITAETEDFSSLTEGVTSRISQLGGYVENQETYYGSSYRDSGSRRSELVIRIPADQLAAFTSQIAEISNVISSRESAEDVTLTYADTESRKKALETQRDRLLELMAKAETMEDLLTIEARLTDVRYELESAASQLKLYDSLVSYSTVYLTIEEVQKLTPVQEQSTWERISTGFWENLQILGRVLLNCLIFLVTGLPYWIPLGLLVFLCCFLVRRHRKAKAARPQKDTPHNAPPET